MAYHISHHGCIGFNQSIVCTVSDFWLLFGYLGDIFPPRSLKYSPLLYIRCDNTTFHTQWLMSRCQGATRGVRTLSVVTKYRNCSVWFPGRVYTFNVCTYITYTCVMPINVQSTCIQWSLSNRDTPSATEFWPY